MATTQKKRKLEKVIQIQVGSTIYKVRPEPAGEVALANARIQKKVQPVFHQIKRARRAAALTASRIVLNA